MTDIIIATYRSLEELTPQLEELHKNTPEPHHVITTCQKASASINRNYGLDVATSDIIIMIDDDIFGFYPGWMTQLITPLDNPEILLVSARLLAPDGTPGPMMGTDGLPTNTGIITTHRMAYRGYQRVPTACIAFRKNPIRFDIGFIGSGYEDTCWMNRLCETYKGQRIVLNNDCKLIHKNEAKNQHGPYHEHNRAYYKKLYPEDII